MCGNKIVGYITGNKPSVVNKIFLEGFKVGTPVNIIHWWHRGLDMFRTAVRKRKTGRRDWYWTEWRNVREGNWGKIIFKEKI